MKITIIQYILLGFTLLLVSSSFAQPDIALANRLPIPVYYSIGKAGSPAEAALNKTSERLDPTVGAVAKTLSYDIGRAGTEVLISARPGEAILFQFIPGKTIYVDIKADDKAKNVILVPQSGTISSLWRKTERGYPLSNNVTKNDIERVGEFTAHDIPATNPQLFLDIYGPRKIGNEIIKAEPADILGTPPGGTTNVKVVNEVYERLAKKWDPNKNSDPQIQPKVKAVYDLLTTTRDSLFDKINRLQMLGAL